MAEQTTREKLLNDVAYAVGRLPPELLAGLRRPDARDAATARAAETIVAHLERSRWRLERPPPREPGAAA